MGSFRYENADYETERLRARKFFGITNQALESLYDLRELWFELAKTPCSRSPLLQLAGMECIGTFNKACPGCIARESLKEINKRLSSLEQRIEEIK